MVDDFYVRTDGDWVNLNDIYVLAGSPANQDPRRWKDTERAKLFIDNLKNQLTTSKKEIYKASRGRLDRGGGTWAHFQIALQYCVYLGVNDTYNSISSHYNAPAKELTIKTIRYEFAFKDLLVDLLRNTKLVKDINKGKGLKVIHQYKCLEYIIDFYLPEVNIAIEYDEEHHEYDRNRIADIRRQYIIENELQCEVIRVKKGNEGSGIANIYSKIMSAYEFSGNPLYLKKTHSFKNYTAEEKR